MSSAEKDREVWSDFAESTWWYTDENSVDHGPYPTFEDATAAMQLHGLEE